MGKKYDQLDIDERYELYRLHEAGKAFREIGRLMGRSASTISRELRRNALPRGEYKPGSADRIALSRCRRLSRIERLSPLRTYVSDRLAMGWSPEQIAGRLRLEGSEHVVGVETIYRFIYRPGVRREKLYRFLPRAKASRGRRYFKRRRDPIEGRRPISERPQAVMSRHEFGHWEGDLMQFRTQRGNLLTVCERKTRFVLTAPLKTKTAAETGKAVIKVLGGVAQGARKTMTFDNGGEFGRHRRLEAAPSRGHLLLRSALALAARDHRKHQRHPAPRHAEENRHHKLHRPRHQRNHLGRQLNTQKMPRLQNTCRGIPRKPQVVHLI